MFYKNDLTEANSGIICVISHTTWQAREELIQQCLLEEMQFLLTGVLIVSKIQMICQLSV